METRFNDSVLLSCRLDVESKLPELLKLVFLNCRAEDKDAALLVLLKQVIGSGVQSAVFVATKHHVEYVTMVRVAPLEVHLIFLVLFSSKHLSF